MIKVKKDKYLRARGGQAFLIDVCCVSCGQVVILYQKDGPEWLKRCYLNRILGPAKWETLQYNEIIKNPKDMPNLSCDCGQIIGYPMLHKDGRLAYRLERGSFKRRRSQQKFEH